MLKSNRLIEDTMNNFKQNSDYFRELVEQLFFTYREMRNEYLMLEYLLRDEFSKSNEPLQERFPAEQKASNSEPVACNT